MRWRQACACVPASGNKTTEATAGLHSSKPRLHCKQRRSRWNKTCCNSAPPRCVTPRVESPTQPPIACRRPYHITNSALQTVHTVCSTAQSGPPDCRTPPARSRSSPPHTQALSPLPPRLRLTAPAAPTTPSTPCADLPVRRLRLWSPLLHCKLITTCLEGGGGGTTSRAPPPLDRRALVAATSTCPQPTCQSLQSSPPPHASSLSASSSATAYAVVFSRHAAGMAAMPPWAAKRAPR